VFLLKMPDQSCFVKLLDFGISKMAHGTARVTQEFDVLGTPDYMSPEQAAGRTAGVDPRADQYAVAVMAYEMLSARVPFVGDSVMVVLRKVVNDEPPSLTDVAPLLPAALSDVVARALSKRPDQRFDSIKDFAVAFAQASGLMMSLPPYSDAPLSFSPTNPGLRAPSVGGAPNPARIDVPRIASAISFSRPPPPPADEEAAPSTQRPAGPIATSDDVHRELDRVRRSVAFAESAEAYAAAHSAMELAFCGGTVEAKKLLEGSSEVMQAVFERKLRGPQGRVILKRMPSPEEAGIAPQQVYLLTRLEDQATLDEALDLSPLSRLQTLWLLARLLDQGAVEIA
jgi:hypothetical protein